MWNLVNLLGWAASFLVLGSYWVSTKTGKLQIFNWGNVIGALILVPVQILSGIWFAALLSGSFGVIAALAIRRDRQDMGPLDTTG